MVRAKPKASVRLRRWARGRRDRWVDPTLQQLEAARRALLAGEADVLYLGQSESVTVHPSDQDTRCVPEIFSDLTGARLAKIAHPGCGARTYKELVRVLGTLEQRPRAVVLTLNIRTDLSTHVRIHPQFTHARTIRALRKISSAKHPVRWIGTGGIVDRADEREAFFAAPVHTRWGGDMTIGEFRHRLEGQGPPPWPIEVERFRFDYFHGEIYDESNPGLQDLRELGAELERYGVPVILFWTLPPIEHGETHFPGEFAAKTEADWQLVMNALRSGFPGMPDALEPGLIDGDFEDSRNATEHFLFRGRLKIAEAMAGALDKVDTTQSTGGR